MVLNCVSARLWVCRRFEAAGRVSQIITADSEYNNTSSSVILLPCIIILIHCLAVCGLWNAALTTVVRTYVGIGFDSTLSHLCFQILFFFILERCSRIIDRSLWNLHSIAQKKPREKTHTVFKDEISTFLYFLSELFFCDDSNYSQASQTISLHS